MLKSFYATLETESPPGLALALNEFKKKASAEKPAMATRKASEAVLEILPNPYIGRFVKEDGAVVESFAPPGAVRVADKLNAGSAE